MSLVPIGIWRLDKVDLRCNGLKTAIADRSRSIDCTTAIAGLYSRGFEFIQL
jgi:hypothetical protein